MSPYALLGLSVLFEVFGDTCMKLSDGFRRKFPILGIAVGYAVSFYALSHVFASLPLGLAYAIWTSAAVALTAVVSRIVWKEKFNEEDRGHCAHHRGRGVFAIGGDVR